jgi:hypothetical protein
MVTRRTATRVRKTCDTVLSHLSHEREGRATPETLVFTAFRQFVALSHPIGVRHATTPRSRATT